MTPEETEVFSVLSRIAISLERIADHIAPEKDARPRNAAVLGTATYTREEREKKELREKLRVESSHKTP